MKEYDYAIVIPVYNGESTLQSLFERVKIFFEDRNNSFQVIFVDDNSIDDSWQQITTLKKKYPENIKAIQLAENCGQQQATLCGIQHSNASIVITIDDDLQHPPQEMKKLITTYHETKADLVYGIYSVKKHGAVRNMGSWFVNHFFKRFAHTSGRGSSFRLISKRLADKLGGVNQKYLLLDEVLNWFTKDLAYVDVEHEERTEGKSGYSVTKLTLITLSYIIYYTIFPLRMMTYVGFFFSLISFVIGVFYLYNRLINEVALGFTSIIVAIFFSTSVILFSLGILGEYVSRIYTKEISKPPYMIKEVL